MTESPVSSPNLRRPYLAVLVLLLVLLLVLRFTYLRAPGADLAASVLATAAQVADALIGAVLAAIGIALLLILVFPAGETPQASQVLAPRAIEGFIRSQTSGTREWLVRVRTASYFRAKTLPWLADSASRDHRPVTVQLVLMDPLDQDLVRLHVRFHQGRTGDWDDRRLVLESCASILACAGAANRVPELDVSVSLSRSFWVVSLDISSSHAIVCGEQKGHPGIAYGAASEFFDTFRSEFRGMFKGARALDLKAVTESEIDTAGKVTDALGKLGLSACMRDAGDADAVLCMIVDPEKSNPYR